MVEAPVFGRKPASLRRLAFHRGWTTTATTQPSRSPLRIFCQERPSAGTGSSRISTGVPSASVVTTGARREGSARTFTLVPPVAPMTAFAPGLGRPAGSRSGRRAAGRPGAKGGGGASVGGAQGSSGGYCGRVDGEHRPRVGDLDFRLARLRRQPRSACWDTGRASTASGVAACGRAGDGELQAPSSTMLAMREAMLPVLTAAMCVLGTSEGSDRRPA